MYLTNTRGLDVGQHVSLRYCPKLYCMLKYVCLQLHFSGLTGSRHHQRAKRSSSRGSSRNESTTISLSLQCRRPIYFGHFPDFSPVHDLVLDLLLGHDHQVDCVREGTPIEGDHESDGVGKLGTLALMVY